MCSANILTFQTIIEPVFNALVIITTCELSNETFKTFIHHLWYGSWGHFIAQIWSENYVVVEMTSCVVLVADTLPYNDV